MDDVSHNAAGYVFPQAGKEQRHILHLHDLASDEEHDTNGCVPEERRGEVEEHRGVNSMLQKTILNLLTNSCPK